MALMDKKGSIRLVQFERWVGQPRTQPGTNPEPGAGRCPTLQLCFEELALLGIPAFVAMTVFAGNSVLCRLALRQTTFDAASFTLILDHLRGHCLSAYRDDAQEVAE
jgi:hypothetical protein